MTQYTKANLAAMKRIWSNRNATPREGSVVPGKPMFDTENDCFYVCDGYTLMCCKGIPQEIRTAGEEIGKDRRDTLNKLMHKHDGSPTAVLATRPNGIVWTDWSPVRGKSPATAHKFGLLYPPEITPDVLSAETELLAVVNASYVRDVILSSPQEIRLFTVPLPFNRLAPLYFASESVSGLILPVRALPDTLSFLVELTRKWLGVTRISYADPMKPDTFEWIPQETKPSAPETIPLPAPQESKSTPAPQHTEITREDVERALLRGTGFKSGKQRVIEQFAKGESVEKNAAFLKNEYGIGGWSHAFGDDTWLDHDSNGITLILGRLTNPTDRKLVPWTDAAAIIDTLITQGKYTADAPQEIKPTAPQPKQETKPAAPANKPAPAPKQETRPTTAPKKPQENQTPAESLAASARKAAPKATVEIKGAQTSCPIVWVYKATAKEADAISALGFVWSNKRQGYWMKPTALSAQESA